MKINKTNQLPTESGFYYVKTKTANYWQCLVRLTGTAPFLTICFAKSLFKTSDEDIVIRPSDLDWSENMSLTNANQDQIEELTDLENEALRIMREEGKLPAVKRVKELTNWGL